MRKINVSEMRSLEAGYGFYKVYPPKKYLYAKQMYAVKSIFDAGIFAGKLAGAASMFRFLSMMKPFSPKFEEVEPENKVSAGVKKTLPDAHRACCCAE